MASIRKHKTGWRVQIDKRGIRKSKVFPTQREAKAWAARTEWEIDNGEKTAAAMTFAELLDRYGREVSAKKDGARWEILRIERMRHESLGRIKLGDLEAKHFGEWRDERLRVVKPSTVRREMGLLSSAINTAVNEWGLLPRNPMKGARRPPEGRPRDRLPTPDEIERMQFVAGDDLTKAQGRAFHAFLFALETAMRAGEIVGLTWGRIDLDRRVAHLDKTKNGTARDVPLSSEAVRLLRALPEADPVFGLTSARLDALFRKVRDKAGVVGLHFHDSRACAIGRLSKKLDVLDLAKMVGHTDLRMLISVYYRESAADLAQRLD